MRAMEQRIAVQSNPATKVATTTTTTTTTMTDSNAAAAAAAASKAAVSDAASGAGDGNAAGGNAAAGGSGLVTSAFAGLIPEAIPGQTYSANKGTTALPGAKTTKTTAVTDVGGGLAARDGGASSSSSSSSVQGNAAAGGASGTTTTTASNKKIGGQTQGMSQAADPTILPTLPADFNWKVYLLYHPDLAARGINNQAKAVEHWLQYGQYEGRVYQRLSVLMRYTACGGLTNQLYSHISALTLAATLGAEVVLPPALTRSSFGHYFSMFKELNQVTWSAVPLDSLIDVDHYIGYWKERGIMLHKVCVVSGWCGWGGFCFYWHHVGIGIVFLGGVCDTPAVFPCVICVLVLYTACIIACVTTHKTHTDTTVVVISRHGNPRGGIHEL